MDFTKLSPSDVKNNPRIILAKPRSPKEECELTTRLGMVQQTEEKYLEENPDAKRNLTPQ